MLKVKERGKLGGRFYLNVFEKRDPITGKPVNLISRTECHNLIPDAALDAWLNIMLHGSTQITTWYCVLFENDFTADGDETYATPGYTECTAYDEATRPAYTEAAASSQTTTNTANKAEFTASDTKTLYGAAIVGGGTAPTVKGDTTSGGTLLCCGKFGTAQPVIDGNVVNLVYEISAADDGV